MATTISGDGIPYRSIARFLLITLLVAAIPPIFTEAFLPKNIGIVAPLSIYGLILFISLLWMVIQSE